MVNEPNIEITKTASAEGLIKIVLLGAGIGSCVLPFLTRLLLVVIAMNDPDLHNRTGVLLFTTVIIGAICGAVLGAKFGKTKR